MIDASSKPFEENIALTKQVVEYAHAHGAVVEAELGTLAGVEDEVVVEAGKEMYTRPEEVEEFVDRTGCDSLAGRCFDTLEVLFQGSHTCVYKQNGVIALRNQREGIHTQVSLGLKEF